MMFMNGSVRRVLEGLARVSKKILIEFYEQLITEIEAPQISGVKTSVSRART